MPLSESPTHHRHARARISPQALSAAGIIAACACAAPASAALLLWNNAAGGSAATAGNWSPTQIPVAADDLQFNLLSTYPVTFNASSLASDSHTYRRGTVSVTCVSPHTIGLGALRVGDVSGDLASMVLATGTMNVSAGSFVGDDAGSTGTLTVNDDDADLILTGAATDLTVGNNGTATLNILGGGRVVVPDQFIAGSNAASIVNMTISGATASLPLSRSTLDVTGVSQSRIGAGGDVTANIANGALAIFDGDVIVSNGSASTSSITVAGLGGIVPQNATLNVAGDLMLGNNGNAVAAGVATLNVNADGLALVNDTLVVAGDPQGGSATLHVATGGEVSATHMTIGDGATLDLDGGNVFIDGGTLTYARTTGEFVIAGADEPIVTLTNGATANLTPPAGFNNALMVGAGTSGLSGGFDVRSGADLFIPASLSNLIIGDGSVCTGSMIVNGVGSTLDLGVNASLVVGRLGDATFEAQQGATVEGHQLYIARFPEATAEMIFENPGTTGDFVVVQVGGSVNTPGGPGDLIVKTGAVFNTDAMHVWPTGVVNLTAGTLNVVGDLDCDGLLELETSGLLNVDAFLQLSGDLVAHPDVAGTVAVIDGRVRAEFGSTILLDNGDLTAGDASQTLGFEALNGSLITVGANTLTLHDSNRARVDEVTINGGHIIAPNGLEIVTPLTNGTLDGTGSITGEVFMESGGSVITATTAAGITFNGQFRNSSGTIDGTKYTFNNNPSVPDCGWTGAGAINAQVVFNSGTKVRALANMSMGDGSNTGVTFNAGSEMYTNTEIVTLLDGNGIGLPSITEIAGGEVTCAQPLTVNSGRVLRGFGDVNAPTLNMLADLRVGDSGKELIGHLDVNGNLTFGASSDTYLHIAGDPIIAFGGPVAQPFDTIAANGLTLNGAMEMRLLDGYSPAVGTIFFLINGTSMTGAFNDLRLQRPGPGRNWLIQYHQPGAAVSLLVNTCIGDISHNGTVEVADLLTVIADWGPCPDPVLCRSDVNLDHQVGVADLLAVIAGWGACP